MKTVCIIQARMGSTRLPGKVIMEVLPGRTILDIMLERVRACRRLHQIVVAVPDSAANDCVASEAERCGASVFRGSETDVLGRYVGAAHAFAAQLLVRLTADCPLIDPSIVDLHVETMQHSWRAIDLVTNMLHPSFPLGIAVEVMPLDTLERMSRLSTTPYLREHVTTIAYEKPEWFLIQEVRDTVNRSHIRWTVDYPEDLAFVRQVFEKMYTPGKVFLQADILKLFERSPAITQVNTGARM